MRAPVMLLLVPLLAGCGSGTGYTTPPEPTTWATGATGLVLAYDPGVPPEHRLPVAEFEAAYAEVEACLDVAAPPPRIEVVPDGALPGHGGDYHPGTGRLRVEDHYLPVRHEMVHYLLEAAGLPWRENAAHAHAGFARCGAIPEGRLF